jgi:hypothetical protein
MSTEPVKFTRAQKIGLWFCAIIIVLYLVLPDPPLTEQRAKEIAVDWLVKNLKDPGSLQILASGLAGDEQSGFRFHIRYRAQNSFGGFVTEDRTFIFNGKGEFISP